MMVEIGAPEICRAQWFEVIATALGKRKIPKRAEEIWRMFKHVHPQHETLDKQNED